MRIVNKLHGPVLVVLALLLIAGCSQNPQGGPTARPEPAVVDQTTTVAPAASPSPTPSPTLAPTATLTAIPPTQADLDAALSVVRNFMAQLSEGRFREAYGALLTTAGQQRLADLVLGRLALKNPHISYFEVLGAEPVGDQIAVDIVWQEMHDDLGPVGTQNAQVRLARQDGAFLIDEVELVDYEPAATPPPPPLPRAEALTNPAVPGVDMQFQGSGFESGETVLAWLELPDGSLTAPSFQTTDEDGTFVLVYTADVTRNLQPGRWIWWAQALRDSTRNTGITFDVAPPPSPTATPTAAPTPTPRPRPTQPPTPSTAPRPTATPRPSSTAYAAPVLLWPEPLTSRTKPGVLVVEFVPVAPSLGPDEYYELVLVARDPLGNVYNAGSVRGLGSPCSGQYGQPCVSLSADQRFMNLFYPSGYEGQGVWYVQVVKQTGPDQFTPISPPSEQRRVILKPAG